MTRAMRQRAPPRESRHWPAPARSCRTGIPKRATGLKCSTSNVKPPTWCRYQPKRRPAMTSASSRVWRWKQGSTSSTPMRRAKIPGVV
uniref:Uncharacterized protein n=1 Tax=Zea mays TaxID=4577 RepID=C0PIS4_MAIZE|nr:unknown [Zea mays]